MTPYNSQQVFAEDIPVTAMTDLELKILSAVFNHTRHDGAPDRVYFFAENHPNSVIELRVRDIIAGTPKAGEPRSTAYSLAWDALMALESKTGEADDNDIVDVPIDDKYLTILQDIVKRNAEIPEIVIFRAFTRSAMKTDGFGGGVTRITADMIQDKTTTDLLNQMRAEHPAQHP